MRLKFILANGFAILMLLFLQTSVFAQDELSQSERLMVEMGIMNKENVTGKFWGDGNVARSEFSSIICKIMNLDASSDNDVNFKDVNDNSKFAKEIKTVVKYGYMQGFGDGYFKPDETIDFNQAVIVMTRLIGYEAKAKALGGNIENYMAAANNAGILKGVHYSEKITRAALANLIYNTLNTECIEVASFGSTLEFKSDKPLIEKTLMLTKVIGVVEETKYTALNQAQSISKNDFLVIDGEKYFCDKDLSNLLGYKVEAYIYDIKDSKALKYIITDTKNKAITVQSSQIDVYETTKDKLVYTPNKDEKDITKSLLISPICNIIKNGRAITNFSLDDLCFKSANQYKDGTVTLLDNNNDSIYEVIFIDSYDTSIVQNTSEYDMKLYLKNGDTTIDLSNNDISFSVYKKNVPINLSEISENDCISYFISDDYKLVKIFVSGNNLLEIVSTIEEETIILSDIEYEFSNKYSYYLQKGSFGNLNVGYLYTFYLDYQDKIVANDVKSRFDTIFAIEMSKNGDLNAKVQLRGLSASGKVKIYDLNEYIMLNSYRKIKSADVYDKNSVLKNNDFGKITNQIILIELDEKGNIRTIETASQAKDESRFSLDEWGVLECRYGNIFNQFYQMRSNGSVFVVPQNISSNDNDYRVYSPSWFIIDSTYNTGTDSDGNGLYDTSSTLKIFDIDNDHTFKLAVYYYVNGDIENKSSSYNSGVLVSNISEIMDAAGELTKVINGVDEFGNEKKIIADEASVFDGIASGDVVCFTMNSNNTKALYTRILFKMGSNSVYGVDVDYTNAVSYGKVSQVFFDRIFLRAANREKLVLPNGRQILIFEKSQNKIRKANFSDVSIDNDMMILVNNYSVLRMAVLYKE